MEELDEQSINAAIILENRVNERIREAIRHDVRKIVVELVNELLRREKGAMIMEVTTSLNQMLKGFVDERRKPLWEHNQEDFKEFEDAIREQTKTV
jgi:hypothetical protein